MPTIFRDPSRFAKSSSRFGPISNEKFVTPVRLPPGLLRLSTSPNETGSTPTLKTMGIVVVATARQRRRGDRVSAHIRRREFITLLGSAVAAWPLAARAQHSDGMRRIAVLSPFAENDPDTLANEIAFRQALEKLGWTHGRRVHIDYRWGGANAERIRAHITELMGLKPEVFVVSTALVLEPLRQQTRSIPIVFTQVTDPVGSGFVANLARPGGNITGFTPAEFSIHGKALEVLKEIAPHITHVAVILNPDQAPQMGMWRAIEAVAPSLGVQLTAAGVRDPAALEPAITAFAREPNGGLIELPSPVTQLNRKLIITLAARHRLPAIYSFRHFVKDGGLISYGVDLADQYRQAAAYVDRILRGENPAELPVQQPTKFELLINLKTAQALGLDVPWFLQQRADDVIE
jgi:putative ABC transport system substrate-binding protein